MILGDNTPAQLEQKRQALIKRNRILSSKRSTQAQRDAAIAECNAVFETLPQPRVYSWNPEFIGPKHPHAVECYVRGTLTTVVYPA